jgi:hypothetical protein
VQQLGLETHAHSQAYPLDRMIKDTNMQVTKKCKFIFSITFKYIDKIEYEVVPLGVPIKPNGW